MGQAFGLNIVHSSADEDKAALLRIKTLAGKDIPSWDPVSAHFDDWQGVGTETLRTCVVLGSKRVERLRLDGLELSLEKDMYEGLRLNLTELSMRENAIRALPKNIFFGMVALQTLNLGSFLHPRPSLPVCRGRGLT
jgi:hypothetical protein